MKTKGYIIRQNFDGDSDNYVRYDILKPNGQVVVKEVYEYRLKHELDKLPDLNIKTIIKEDYVSFETAKLLKEKGFNWNCESKRFYPEPDYDQESPNGVYAPTIQMAMKWLREVHNLHIVVFYYDNSAFPYIWYIFAHNGDKPHKANSYEEACEDAIKYCLENLI